MEISTPDGLAAYSIKHLRNFPAPEEPKRIAMISSIVIFRANKSRLLSQV